ncbi:uncharacterized protein L203_100530 [Cryptococcus depauperatus CBS 7841]|uniref:S1-like domain-containing protein n=1 Tax=Cryptococcus depauperatus CBS 7841 TaxID=1295531 RepID=A0AAJ8JN85_9TREE|nr:hypothetical protein L204_01534 [Cryptococcus depauperatus CBS 7855]
MARKQQSTPSYGPPLPSSHHLVRLGAPQGSNNYLCVDAEGIERLVEVSKPLKRNKMLFIMRGDFAVINLFPTVADEKTRLVGEILHILDKGDVKEWKKSENWPRGFEENLEPTSRECQAEEKMECEEQSQMEESESRP